MTNKERLKLVYNKYRRWLKSLGIRYDKKGNMINNFKGFDLPDLSVRNSLPCSNNIAGSTAKRIYATQIPAGKTISVAYNKGPYMIVDAKDFKTMGRKI